MAQDKHDSYTIFNQEFAGGQAEVTAQNLNVLNAASGGAITMTSERHTGYYTKTTFYPRLSSITARRDVTSTSTQSDNAPSNTVVTRVKCFRKFKPVGMSIGAWQTMFGTSDPRELSFLLGRWYQSEKLSDMVNLGLAAVEAALEGQSSLVYDATGETTKTLTPGYLASGLALVGDQARRITTWVVHSKPDNDLLKQAISDKVVNIADLAIREGTTPYLGRRSVVTDAAALTDANGSLTDTYNTLGLVPGALQLTESEQEQVAFELITGYENLFYRFQAEYEMTIGVLGFTWDVTNGGTNPTDAAVATTTNWDKVASSVKDCAGVRIKTQ